MGTTGSTGAIIEGVRHVPQFGGNVWYVSKGDGDNDNSGDTPNSALETIGAAILKLSVGDAINVMAGTYTEVGLDLNVASCELWFEIGALIDPATGTALTISGNACKIKGNHKITPAAAQIGLLITGNECVVADGRILGGGTGLKTTGSGLTVNRYGSGNQTAVAYDIQGAQTKLICCSTVGIGATYGFKINDEVDTGVLRDCTSVGHTTAGFFIGAASIDWTLINCSSGAKDGRWVDTDNANVWSNFSYADEVNATSTFTAGVTTFNIFKLTGSVRLTDLLGHVETVIPGVASTMYIELYSSNGDVDITDSPGVQINAAIVDTIFIRNEDATNPLILASPAVPAVVETTTYRDPKNHIDLIADSAEDTYIRVVLSDAQASGAIHWHAHWSPLTEKGFLESV